MEKSSSPCHSYRDLPGPALGLLLKKRDLFVANVDIFSYFCRKRQAYEKDQESVDGQGGI
ncbi:hypothetical protein SAMN05216383_10639 [Prevotella sp. KH2C16]|nr:hypothetical protein SAMN05216383_10639 [Prevotella sp. KH2C16]